MVLAIDEDNILNEAKKEFGENPNKKQIEEISRKRIKDVAIDFTKNNKFLERLPEIKKETEIIMDMTPDVVEEAGFSQIAKEKAREVVGSFKEFIEKNKHELDAYLCCLTAKMYLEEKTVEIGDKKGKIIIPK